MSSGCYGVDYIDGDAECAKCPAREDCKDLVQHRAMLYTSRPPDKKESSKPVPLLPSKTSSYSSYSTYSSSTSASLSRPEPRLSREMLQQLSERFQHPAAGWFARVAGEMLLAAARALGEELGKFFANPDNWLPPLVKFLHRVLREEKEKGNNHKPQGGVR